MSRVEVQIPSAFRELVGGAATIPAQGSNVREVLDQLVREHPALRTRLYSAEGTLRNFVGVYRNDVDVRGLEREATPVADGDEITIVPAVAGG